MLDFSASESFLRLPLIRRTRESSQIQDNQFKLIRIRRCLDELSSYANWQALQHSLVLFRSLSHFLSYSFSLSLSLSILELIISKVTFFPVWAICKIIFHYIQSNWMYIQREYFLLFYSNIKKSTEVNSKKFIQDFAYLNLIACRGGGDNDRSDKIKKRIACLTQIASSPHNHHGSHHSATGHYP